MSDDTGLAAKLSIVVPLYNEEQNIEPLLQHVHEVLAQYAHGWELILVDDGSSDTTLSRARELAAHYGTHVRVVGLQRNFGQTAAMQAGIDLARGELVATMDGDLQNDPADIPAMVERLQAEGFDLIQGWRLQRKDNLLRRVPSRIANWLIGVVTGVRLHDYGCSLKVYRASVVKNVRLYGEMHRFIPAWIAAVAAPGRIAEMVVNHNPRTRGTSSYGLGRVFRVVLDLLAVLFFIRYKARPGHFFGSIGLWFGTLGAILLVYLAWVKFAAGEDIGGRPLLLVAIVCVIAAFQFLTTGVLAELMSRIYFESTHAKAYVVREDSSDQIDAAEWHEARSG